MIQQMLAIWSLVPLPFLKPAWTSGSSQFTYCWSLASRILSITLLACEMSAVQIKHRMCHVPLPSVVPGPWWKYWPSGWSDLALQMAEQTQGTWEAEPGDPLRVQGWFTDASRQVTRWGLTCAHSRVSRTMLQPQPCRDTPQAPHPGAVVRHGAGPAEPRQPANMQRVTRIDRVAETVEFWVVCLQLCSKKVANTAF